MASYGKKKRFKKMEAVAIDHLLETFDIESVLIRILGLPWWHSG